MKLAIILISAAITLAAQQHEPAKRQRLIVWYFSALALGAGSAMDLATSYGHKYETNPLLRGANQQISTERAIGIKVAPIASWLLVQRLLLRRHPGMQKMFEIYNFAGASALGAVAGHNATVP